MHLWLASSTESTAVSIRQVVAGFLGWYSNGVVNVDVDGVTDNYGKKMKEEGIEPPTAGSGIQRSTTELSLHHDVNSTNKQNT